MPRINTMRANERKKREPKRGWVEARHHSSELVEEGSERGGRKERRGTSSIKKLSFVSVCVGVCVAK